MLLGRVPSIEHEIDHDTQLFSGSNSFSPFFGGCPTKMARAPIKMHPKPRSEKVLMEQSKLVEWKAQKKERKRRGASSGAPFFVELSFGKTVPGNQPTSLFLACCLFVFFSCLIVLFIFTGGLQKTKFLATIRVEMTNQDKAPLFRLFGGNLWAPAKCKEYATRSFQLCRQKEYKIPFGVPFRSGQRTRVATCSPLEWKLCLGNSMSALE